MSAIEQVDIVTLFRKLREAYRQAHQDWVAGCVERAIEALQQADTLSSMLQEFFGKGEQ